MLVFLAVVIPVIAIAILMSWGIRRIDTKGIRVIGTESRMDWNDLRTGGFLVAVVVLGTLACLYYPAIRIPVGILVICVLIAIGVGTFRDRRAAQRLTGIGQILSVESMTQTEGPNPRYMCRIALRVEIPGRPTYNATSSTSRFMTAAEIATLQPGKAVAVTVLSANPQDVRIDFSQPIT